MSGPPRTQIPRIPCRAPSGPWCQDPARPVGTRRAGWVCGRIHPSMSISVYPVRRGIEAGNRWPSRGPL